MARQHEPQRRDIFRGKGNNRRHVGWRVDWYNAVGKRERPFFNLTQENEANLFLEKKRREFALADTGLNLVATKLTDVHLRYVEQALALLEEKEFLQISRPDTTKELVELVRWLVDNYDKRPDEMMTVAQLIALFLTAKKVKAPATQVDYAKNLNIFARTPCDRDLHPGKKYGDLRVDEVTTKDVAAFLQSRVINKTTESKYYGALRALFYFAARTSEYLEVPLLTDNPVLGILHPAKPTDPKRHRYTVDEIKRLMQVSIYLRCAPLVIVRLFTMLRQCEASRLIAGPKPTGGRGRPVKYDPWEKFELKRKAPKLPYHEADETDSAARDITLYTALVAWIEVFQRLGVPLHDTRREIDARRIAVPQKFDGEFTNLIRHTAISFRASICDSLLEVGTEADTTERIIKKHYLHKVEKPDAEEMYWLTPDKFDLRIYDDSKFPSATELKALKKEYPGIGEFLRARS